MSERFDAMPDPDRQSARATDDPLAALIARSLRAEVNDVRSEIVRKDASVELERVRFVQEGRPRSLVFKRVATDRALEVQLLPFLARKTDRVPAVHARGIPPPMVPAPQWVLTEDLLDAPSACEVDPRLIVEAKIAVERAVERDAPALRALGVPELLAATLAENIASAVAGTTGGDRIAAEAREAARRLAKWPTGLVHGDLVCANAVDAERGVVLMGWESAYLGCPLLDVVRLTADIVERGDAVLGIGLSRLYSERLERVLPTEILRGAETLERLVRRHLRRYN